jgi:hypothetical protein
MADLIPPMLIQLQADVSQLKVGLAQAESAIKGVDRSVETASTGMTNFIGKVKQIGASLGIAFAGTQVLQFGRDVIAQAMEAEAQQQRLYQLMKVGTGATDEQVAALNAQAEALEKVGVVTGGNITQTQSQLATFNLQAETIQRLTPAILDYVTAEKGANASADEFKQMTNGLAQALNGNFGSLTRVGFVLDDHTKKLISSGTEAEKSAAIVDVLNSTYKGFNAELRNTPEGQMQALRNDFDALKTDLGKKLLPALLGVTGFLTNTFIPALRSLGKFIKDNGDAIKIYAGIIVIATGVFYAYKAALVVTSTATVVYTAVTKSMAAGFTLAQIAAFNLKVAIFVLNAAIRANPIGAIITALTILGAAFVFAWKKSETFREIIIKGVQIVLTGFAYLVQGIGKFIGMLSKVPGMGWAKGIADGAKNASDSIKATSKNLSDLKSNVKAGYGEGAFTYGSGKGTGGGGGGGGGGGDLSKEEKSRLKKLEKYQKDVLKIYKDMNDAMADGQDKAEKELEQRNDKMIEAQKNYDETMIEAHKRYKETIEDAEKDHADRVADLQYRFNDIKEKAEKRSREADLEANALYKERTIEIEEQYKERKEELQKKNLETLAKAQKAYDEKELDLRAKFEDVKEQAQKRFDKVESDAKERKQKAEEIANKRFDNAMVDAKERRQKAEEAAEKRFNDIQIQIKKDYAKKVLDLNNDLEKKLTDLRENAAKKSTDLTKAATEKQLNIVQQSMDRLRNAFASKTGFNLADAFGMEEFGGAASGDQLLGSMKQRLNDTKNLAKNAALLQGSGFSQTFIEQVVAAGPEVGNKLAQSILNSSPQSIKELQNTFVELEKTTSTGLDALATTMNAGGILATQELTNAYRAVSSDLSLALSDIQKELQTNLAEVNSVYETALTEAKTTRDEKLTDAAKTLEEALATSKTVYNASVAEATTALKEALATAKTDFDAAIADAKTTLAEALVAAKENLDESLADALKALNEAKVAAQKDLDEGLAAADKTYTEALAKAKKALDDALAESKKTLTEAMAEAQKDLDKGLADAAKALEEAREKAKKALDEKLADAQKVLQDALIKAQKDYETAIDAIAKATDDKLANLKTKLAEVAASMTALGAAQAAANALANAPVVVPVIPGAVVGGGNALELLKANEAGTKITINTTNLTDPASVAAAVSSEIKFGAVVTATRAVTVSNGGLKID